MHRKIILFEDTDQYGRDLLGALEAKLKANGEVKLFEPPAPAVQEGLYEDRLAKDLQSQSYKDATLIVADRDLSKTKAYNGLSESTVKRVADRLDIPECGYARGEKEEQEFLRSAEVREARIAVSIAGGADKFADDVTSIADGFAFIAERLPEALKSPGKKSAGKLLATIVGKPEYADKIALYASGDQNRLASVLRVHERGQENQRRLTCLLGYWLWDSVLRFPGVVVNGVAASSYLNIKDQEFISNQKIQSLFEKARYRGPFAAAKEPLWWRGMLDDLVGDSGCADGREFVEKEIKQAIPRSQCCEDTSKPAGYYCMLRKMPVSLENSRPGLSWFPRGADLARISRSKYEEEVPWLGD